VEDEGMKSLAIFLMMIAGVSALRASQRHVLVEMLTNAHCPLCPPADEELSTFAAKDTNAINVRYIFYHMTFPYSDDPLAQANIPDASARNNYYGPFSATPVGIFDGVNAGTLYYFWGPLLDSLVGLSSPLEIALSGSRDASGFTVNAKITATAPVGLTDLRIHFVLVETVDYTGRNGVHPQLHAMRKMLDGADGDPVSIQNGQSVNVTKQSPFTNVADPSAAGVVVFVQSAGSKSVLQSEYIGIEVLTDVADETENRTPATFALYQNYPNPFNPTTVISCQLPVDSKVRLAVFDMLGRLVATVADGRYPAGKHSFEFDAKGLASGMYFYRLEAGRFVDVKRLVLLQ
jgi:hypothetical protein